MDVQTKPLLWAKDHPVNPRNPSLQERLSDPEKVKTTKPPLLERLSRGLKPWLNPSELGRIRSRTQLSKSARSSPKKQTEMNRPKVTHSTNILQPSMESKPSLLNRLNMGCDSSTPDLFSESKRTALAMEVKDMRHLTGVILEPCPSSMSTTSLKGYPRDSEVNRQWEEVILKGGQIVNTTQGMTSMIEVDQIRNRESSSPRCHGLAQNNKLENPTLIQAVTRQEASSKSSRETPPLSKGGLGVPQPLQLDSQPPSRMRSLKEKPLISTQSSVLCTTSTALMKVSDTLDLLKSSLGGLNPRQKLKRAASGPQHSTSLSKRPRSFSLIDTMNFDSTETIWRRSSPQNQQQCTQNCSNTTKPSDIKLGKAKISCLPTDNNSLDIMRPSSLQTVSELKDRVREAKGVQERAQSLEKNLTYAIDSMERRDVAPLQTSASTSISAKNASRVDMEKWTAKSMRECEDLGRKPRYLRHNLYRDDDKLSRSCSEWTDIAKPLPSVPELEYSNVLACHTIDRHPGLFTVDTPVNVDEFEGLLSSHPNRPFVNSVISGFRNGFWPWADTHTGEYPHTLDESLGDPRDPKEFVFICGQRDKEIAAGRFSESFGENLLPGMYSMPIHAVPKPHSTDLRLVTNHSAGEYSLNSMIKREDIAGFPLDNMTHLGEMLLKKREEFLNEELILFKSDISDAYRNLPMHPLWQVKQVNTIGGQRHVDRRNCFGGKGSGSLFISTRW